MTHDPSRALRLRWERLHDPAAPPGRLRTPGADALATPGSPRFVGRVTTASSPPTETGRVFLVNPASLGGPEAAGGPAELSVDASRAIPVLVVGSAVPRVGDLIVAHSVGGRWVAALHGSPLDAVPCGGCAVPRRDLTLTIAGRLSPPQSHRMAYDGLDGWTSDCIGQVRYRLTCRQGAPRFRATYHQGGTCEAGSPATCGSDGQAPSGLAIESQSCTPFLLRFSAEGCQTLASLGYVRFTLTA